MDLDENKATGLRLRLSYIKNNVEVSLGGYGYMGDYTDNKKPGPEDPVLICPYKGPASFAP